MPIPTGYPGSVIAIIPTARSFEGHSQSAVPSNGAMSAYSGDGARVSFRAGCGTATAPAPARRAVIGPLTQVEANGASGKVFVLQDGKVEERTVKLGAQSRKGRSCSQESNPVRSSPSPVSGKLSDRRKGAIEGRDGVAHAHDCLVEEHRQTAIRAASKVWRCCTRSILRFTR